MSYFDPQEWTQNNKTSKTSQFFSLLGFACILLFTIGIVFSTVLNAKTASSFESSMGHIYISFLAFISITITIAIAIGLNIHKYITTIGAIILFSILFLFHPIAIEINLYRQIHSRETFIQSIEYMFKNCDKNPYFMKTVDAPLRKGWLSSYASDLHKNEYLVHNGKNVFISCRTNILPSNDTISEETLNFAPGAYVYFPGVWKTHGASGVLGSYYGLVWTNAQKPYSSTPSFSKEFTFTPTFKENWYVFEY
jgi:hypothetical protein